MFIDFLYALREQKVPVGMQEWLAFSRGLDAGLAEGSLSGLYHLGRSVLIHSEGFYDAYDIAFARFFSGLGVPPEVSEALRRWLETPADQRGAAGPPPELSEKELFERFERLLREQNERHDGGRFFIGTRGVSPLGNAGENPQGMRVGGESGNRSAIYMAESRQFAEYRDDLVLDVRQFSAALKGLRHLRRDGHEMLDVDRTISRSADNGGEIELAWTRDRRNALKLLLLMDVGGSMEPYRKLVSQLFTATKAARHFKRFEFRYFHNCPYARIYKDPREWDAEPTEALLKELGPDFRVLFVGDACMAPWELGMSLETPSYGAGGNLSGLGWIKRISHHFDDAVWLNPEPETAWNHPTIQAIGRVVPMYPLTLSGLRRAVRRLRIGREGEGEGDVRVGGGR